MRRRQPDFLRILALVLPLLAIRASAAGKWIHLKSPNFEAISDASESAAQSRLDALERFRAVMTNGLFRNSSLGLPTRVFLLKDNKTVGRMVGFSANRRIRFEGGYMPGVADNQIVIDLDDDRASKNQISQHEYLHLLTRYESKNWPMWFNEGVASCFQTAWISGSKVTFGEPLEHAVPLLRRSGMMPWRDLFATDAAKFRTLASSKVELVYPQSWLLVHYLFFALPDNEKASLDRFFVAFDRKQDSFTAFKEVFGWSEEEVDRRVTAYLNSGRFFLKVSDQNKAPSFPITIEPAPQAVVDGWSATWKAESGKEADVTGTLEQVKKAGIENAWTCLAEGIALYKKDEKSAAVAKLRRAVELDSELVQPKIWFAIAAGVETGGSDAVLQREARENLRKVVESHPGHQSAWALLAMAEMNVDGPGKPAADAFVKAIKLDPRDYPTRLRAGVMLLGINLPHLARPHLEAVVEGCMEPMLVEGARKALDRL